MSNNNKTHLASKQGYNRYAQFYDEKLEYLDSFEKNEVLPMLGNVKNKKILDVGAGTGRMAVRLAKSEAEVTAIDVSENILKILAKKNRNIKIIVGDAEKLPFTDNKFDIILATFLIVHLKELKYFLKEAYRVLKPEGKILITNINQKKPPKLKTRDGDITIESYYHRPEKVIGEMINQKFQVEEDLLVEEGKTWVNQIILGEK